MVSVRRRLELDDCDADDGADGAEDARMRVRMVRQVPRARRGCLRSSCD